MIAQSPVINSGKGITCLPKAIIVTKWLQNICWFTAHVFDIYVFFFLFKIWQHVWNEVACDINKLREVLCKNNKIWLLGCRYASVECQVISVPQLMLKGTVFPLQWNSKSKVKALHRLAINLIDTIFCGDFSTGISSVIKSMVYLGYLQYLVNDDFTVRAYDLKIWSSL